MKSTWYKVYNYGKSKNKNKTVKKKSDDDDGEFQQQSPQQLVYKYKHTSGRNDHWRIQLKLIQEEYYFIGNQKS